jgi:hypothetical protein
MSPRIRVNTADDESKPDLPAGDYVCTLETCEQKKGPKADYLAVTLKIAEGPGEGLTIWDNITLSENAKFRAANFAKAFGGGEGELDVDTDEFIDRPVIARCATEVYEGYSNLRVKKYIMHDAVREHVEKELGGKSESTPSPEPAAAGSGKKSFKI